MFFFVFEIFKEKGIRAHLAPPPRQPAPRGSPPPWCSSGTRRARFWGAVTIKRRRRGGAASALPPSLKRSKKWSPHGSNFKRWSPHGPDFHSLLVLPLPSLADHWPGPPSVGRRRGHGRGAVQTDRSREKGRSRWLIRVGRRQNPF